MIRLRWISFMLVVVLIGGCGHSAQGPTTKTSSQPGHLFPNWPPLLNDFRFHWTSEPEIDVTTGPAMVVRAYLESYGVAETTFNADNVYPGFNRATPENQQREGSFLWQLVNVQPMGHPFTSTPEEAQPHFGYKAFHFLELTPAGNGYRAIVCSGNYGEFVPSASRPGKFSSVGVDDSNGQPWPRGFSGVSPHQIELSQHDPRVGANPPSPPTVPQTGPAPAPDQDVFGNWFITGASQSFWGPFPDPKSFHPELEQRCEAAMPVPEDERLAIMTGFKDKPPPHGEAIPGWPRDAN
jgi:hypothetical protein